VRSKRAKNCVGSERLRYLALTVKFSPKIITLTCSPKLTSELLNQSNDDYNE